MTAEELKDICLCGETTKVQFKEAPIPQKELAREMIAFANSKGGVKFVIGKLQQKGLLKRVGGRKHGEWQVLLP